MQNAPITRGVVAGVAVLVAAAHHAGAEPQVLQDPLHSLGLGTVKAIDYSAEVSRILTGGPRGIVLWNADTGQVIHEIVQPGVTSVALAIDGSKMLAGALDAKAYLWDAESGELLKTLEGHTRSVQAVDISHDGSMLLTGSRDARALVWDTETAAVLREFNGADGFRENVTAVAFSRDGTLVATGTTGITGVLRVFNTQTGHPSLGVWGTDVAFVGFNASGTHVLSAAPTSLVAYRPVDGGGSGGRGVGLGSERAGLSFTPDGLQAFASTSFPYHGQLHDIANHQVTMTFEGHEGRIIAAVVAYDGETVVTAGLDQTVRLWNMADGTEIRRFEGHSSTMRYVAFSPDGSRVLTSRDSGDDTLGSLRLWNPNTAQAIGVLSGLPGQAYSSMFSTNGSHAITRRGNAVLLWDAATGELLREFHHAAEVEALTFSPDGSRILTGTADGGAWIWDSGLEPRAVPSTWVLQ